MKRPKEKSKNIRLLVGILVSAVAIYFLGKNIDIRSLWESLRYFSWIDIAIIIGITTISFLVRGLVWRDLLPNTSTKDAFLIVNQSYLVSNLIPRSGELAKAILFRTPSKLSAFEIFSRVIVERSFDMIIAAGMFLITFPRVIGLENIQPIATALFLVFILITILFFYISLKPDQAKRFLKKTIGFNQWLAGKILPIGESIIDGFSVLRDWKSVLKVLMWIMISWGLWTSLIFYGLKVINPEAKLYWAIFTEGVLALGVALPSAPANIGIYEGTMVVALSLFGIQQAFALSIAILLHVISIILVTLFGIIGFFSQDLSINDLLNDIRSNSKKKPDQSI